MKINGRSLTGYTAGSPVWEQEVDLAGWENDFYIMAYDASGELIGLDFLKVYLVDPSLARFRIDNPVEKVLILQTPALMVEGETPFTTRRIYRNRTEIPFQSGDHPSSGLVNLPWTDSVELSLGENPIEYQAVDESGQEIDRDGLLAIYTGIMRIVEPVADSTTYTTTEDTIHIVLQMDQPARGSTLTINNALLPSYSGQSTVGYQSSLREGENRFVFRLANESGTPTGYSAITVTRTSDIQQVKEKEKVGEGFCFIRSLLLSSRPFPQLLLSVPSSCGHKSGYIPGQHGQ
ncbi:MAG: hypothetical protein AB1611_15005 [bacterium]